MVSSPEESVGFLPPGFLYEREVEPVGRYVVPSLNVPVYYSNVGDKFFYVFLNVGFP